MITWYYCTILVASLLLSNSSHSEKYFLNNIDRFERVQNNEILSNPKSENHLISSFEKKSVLVVNDISSEYFYDQGNYSKSNKQYTEAISYYDKAIEIKPDYFEAWNNRGMALASIEKYAEAINSYNRAI